MTDPDPVFIFEHQMLYGTEGPFDPNAGWESPWKAIVRRLVKTRDEELVGRLVDEAEQRFLSFGLSWRVLLAARRHLDARTHAGKPAEAPEVEAVV